MQGSIAKGKWRNVPERFREPSVPDLALKTPPVSSVYGVGTK